MKTFNLTAPRIFFLVVLITAIIMTNIHTRADQPWSQFRGLHHTGAAPQAATPPIKWNADQFVWEVNIPGTGWSSPVLDEERIWLTTAISQEATPEAIEEKLAGDLLAKIKTVAASVEFRAVCIDLESGRIIHNIALAKIDQPDVINPLNSYASPTPAMANGRVICHFGSYGTWCLDAQSGKTIWNCEYKIDHSVGPGSSPIIYNSKIILTCDGMDNQFIAAVNLSDGKEIWKTNRPPIRASNGEFKKAYCTPLVIDVAGKPQAIIPGAQWIVAYDPDSGKEIWRADHGDGFSVTPMASYESGLVVFTTGYGKPDFVAVDPRGTGDVTKTHLRWRARNAPAMSSLVTHGGKIISISDRGILSCLDAKTGEVVEQKRIGGNFSASPLLAGDHVYFCSREGLVSVVSLAAGFETVASNRFPDSIMASPAVFENDLIIRTAKQLIRIRGGQTSNGL